MDKIAVIKAFRQSKLEEIRREDVKISTLQALLRNAHRVDPSDIDRVAIQRDIAECKARKKPHEDCLTSLESLSVPNQCGDGNIQLGSLVAIKDCHDRSQTFLLIPQGGGCCIKHDGQEIFCLSRQAPLGKALLLPGQKPGITFPFKDTNYMIESVE